MSDYGCQINIDEIYDESTHHLSIGTLDLPIDISIFIFDPVCKTKEMEGDGTDHELVKHFDSVSVFAVKVVVITCVYKHQQIQ